MAYKQMAHVYDQFMASAPYESWVNFTKKLFEQSNIPINHVVELGCGTGEITTRLAKKGYTLTGVDYSSDMLSHAEQKSSTQNLSIQWLHQDLRTLQGLKDLDAAISYCDVINYITTEKDLKKVFNHVFEALKDGGLFIFDVHSLSHVHQNLINRTFSDVTDDSSYIWFCMEGDTHGEMYHDMTFFSRDGDSNKYTRFDETHHQKTYSIEIYKQLLDEAGLKVKNIYGDFSLKANKLDEQTMRIFFLTEKRLG